MDEAEVCLCDHEESHKDESIWVKPHIKDRVHSPTQRKTFCKKCGKLRYSGSYHAKKIGYYINLLNEIKRRADVLRKRGVIQHSLTKVQIRLILKELEVDEFFSDSFSTSSNDQMILFRKTLDRICPLPQEVVEPVIRDFKG